MKTKQQLLKEASLLKQKLVQVEKQINLSEVKRMQQLAGILKEGLTFEDPEFKEIAIPLMNSMLNDCLDNYDGNFEEWVEYGMSNPPDDVKQGLSQLEQMSNEEEVEKFVEAAYEQIEKYLESH